MEIQDRPEQLNSFRYGGIAQLGERLLCKQEVNGSIPFISTMQPNAARRPAALCGGKPAMAGLIREGARSGILALGNQLISAMCAVGV